jgi:hypothetical protein
MTTYTEDADAEFDALVAEFDVWISDPAQTAFAGAGDALEIRMFAELTAPQIAWLDDFIARWDAMEENRAYAPDEDAALKAAWDAS